MKGKNAGPSHSFMVGEKRSTWDSYLSLKRQTMKVIDETWVILLSTCLEAELSRLQLLNP